MEQSIDVAKLVYEYLLRLHRHYKLDKHQTDTEFANWCLENLGREHRDWFYHAGTRHDEYSVLHVKNYRLCIFFELRWSNIIIGTIDIK